MARRNCRHTVLVASSWLSRAALSTLGQRLELKKRAFMVTSKQCHWRLDSGLYQGHGAWPGWRPGLPGPWLCGLRPTRHGCVGGSDASDAERVDGAKNDWMSVSRKPWLMRGGRVAAIGDWRECTFGGQLTPKKGLGFVPENHRYTTSS